jgi:hypothetical protein
LFQEAITLGSTTDDEKWKKAVFWVFDAPSIADKPYEVVQLIIIVVYTYFAGENSIFEGNEQVSIFVPKDS